MSTPHENSETGKAFEDAFRKKAMIEGFLVIQNFLSARYTYNQNLQVMPSHLDFMVATPTGRIAFVDCKNFDGDSFPYSKLKPEQIERAALLNEWSVPAGFIILLRGTNAVRFYTGKRIQEIGPGNSMGLKDGISLGTVFDFKIKKIFSSLPPVRRKSQTTPGRLRE